MNTNPNPEEPTMEWSMDYIDLEDLSPEDQELARWGEQEAFEAGARAEALAERNREG